LVTNVENKLVLHELELHFLYELEFELEFELYPNELEFELNPYELELELRAYRKLMFRFEIYANTLN
jgi:hypothetical protein